MMIYEDMNFQMLALIIFGSLGLIVMIISGNKILNQDLDSLFEEEEEEIFVTVRKDIIHQQPQASQTKEVEYSGFHPTTSKA